MQSRRPSTTTRVLTGLTNLIPVASGSGVSALAGAATTLGMQLYANRNYGQSDSELYVSPSETRFDDSDIWLNNPGMHVRGGPVTDMHGFLTQNSHLVGCAIWAFGTLLSIALVAGDVLRNRAVSAIDAREARLAGGYDAAEAAAVVAVVDAVAALERNQAGGPAVVIEMPTSPTRGRSRATSPVPPTEGTALLSEVGILGRQSRTPSPVRGAAAPAAIGDATAAADAGHRSRSPSPNRR